MVQISDLTVILCVVFLFKKGIGVSKMPPVAVVAVAQASYLVERRSLREIESLAACLEIEIQSRRQQGQRQRNCFHCSHHRCSNRRACCHCPGDPIDESGCSAETGEGHAKTAVLVDRPYLSAYVYLWLFVKSSAVSMLYALSIKHSIRSDGCPYLSRTLLHLSQCRAPRQPCLSR